MIHKSQFFKFWQDKSIGLKLKAAISLFLFLMLFIALTGIISLYQIRKAEQIIRINTSIQSLTFEMERDMGKARHLHANFFLHYPQMGLQKAHENFAQPSIRKTAMVVSTSQALKEMINHPDVRHSFQESQIDFNLYLSSAKRFADTSIESFELAAKLATPENGLEDILKKNVRELKAQLAQFKELALAGHDIEDMVNRYWIERKRHYIQSAFNSIFLLEKRLETKSFVRLEKIKLLIAHIKKTADEILKIDVAIDSKFKDFILQEQSAHSASEKIIRLMKQEVARVQHNILVMQQMASAILIGVTLFGLIAAAIIANALNTNITRRIVALTRVTTFMQKGHFNAVADESSQDELGHLGKTFNFMATRIKGHVDNLEQAVEERTRQLSETNKNLEIEIRDRKQAEKMLKQKESFLNRVIDQSPFSTWISDAHGTLEKSNTALRKALNLTDYQLVGKYNVFNDPLMKRQNLLPLIRTVYENGRTIHFSCDWDGNDIPQMDLKGSNAVSIEATMFPVFDAHGELTNAVLNWIDVSEKKQIEAEKNSLEQQLRQSHKMEAIGILAGGIAHDFNNILGIMLGNAELALSDLPDWSPSRESLMEIKTAGLRAKEVVRQLLSFSRKTELNQTPQDLVQIVKESLNLLRASIPSSVQIIEDIADKDLFVMADATQLHQVIINLSTNAAHAMEGKGGILGIHLSRFDGNSKTHNTIKDLPSDDCVELRISDTGTGISHGIIENIFDPYFTTKEFGKGTGMGLSVVHGIIKSHNAVIHVDSKPDHGTSFRLFFTKLKKVEKIKKETRIEAPPHGTERLLFIDDESPIVDMMSRMLRKLGYHVTGKTDPREAVDEFKANSENIDLVITDMTMPQMDGLELTQKLKEIKPDVPIIVCTGNSSLFDDKNPIEMGISACAMKPISMLEIAREIRNVLDRELV